MASLSVLFEGRPDARGIAGALVRTGALDGTTSAAAGRMLALDVDGTRVEVELVAAPVLPELLAEAVVGGPSSDSPTATSHVAHASVRAVPRVTSTMPRGPGDGLRAMSAATRVADALLSLPGAVALWAEDGRVLTGAADAARRLASHSTTPPLDLWIGVRRFELADAQGLFLDTLGMTQLALPDLEAYSSDGDGAAHMTAWLRMVCLHLAQAEAPLRAGDTLDGPDDAPWMTVEDSATVEPARAVLRFVPV